MSRARLLSTALLLLLAAVAAVGLVACGGGGESDADPITSAQARGERPDDAGSYPRLFIGPRELAELRESVSEPGAFEARVFDRVEASAEEGLVRPPDSEYPDEGPWQETYYAFGSADSDLARDMAFAYAVSGDERYAEGVRRYLLEWVDTHEPSITDNQIGVVIGFGLMFQWAYDLTYGSTVYSDDERQRIRAWFLDFAETWAKGMQGALQAGTWGSREGQPIVGRDDRLHRENMGSWASAYAAITGFMFDEPDLVAFGVEGGGPGIWRLKPGYAALADLPGYPESTANPQSFMGTLSEGTYDDGTLWDEHVRRQVGYPTWQLQALSLTAEAGVRNGRGMSLWNAVAKASDNPDNERDHNLALAFDHYGPIIAGEVPDPYEGEAGERDARFFGKASTYYELPAKRLGPRVIPGSGGLTYADVRDSRGRSTAEDYHLFGLTSHLVGAAGA